MTDVPKLRLADVLTPEALARYRARQAERERVMAAARERFAAITDPLARTVLDLHTENDRHECTGDDMDGHDAVYPEWPCRTVEAIAAHYGIELP